MLLKFHPNHIKVKYLKCAWGKVGATSTLVPKSRTLGLSLRKAGDDVLKATSDWKGLRGTEKLTLQDRFILKSYLLPLFWSLKPRRSHQEMERSRKTLSTVKNVTVDEIVNISQQIQNHSLVGEHSAIIKGFWTLQSVGCSVDEHQLWWHSRYQQWASGMPS